MSISDESKLLAAEYALGTLDWTERNAATSRRATDAEFDAEVARWETNLIAMTDEIREVKPAVDLLPGILRQLSNTESQELKNPDKVVVLRKQVTRWKRVALATSLLAASFGAVAIFTPAAMEEVGQNYIAVFQKDDQQPAFLLSINLESRALSIRPVSADPHSDKTYQLWILEENIGPAPQSLGLLNKVSQPTEKTLDQFDVEVLKAATFGISLEPPGGSPTGKPSEGAIHGFLYPVETSSPSSP